MSAGKERDNILLGDKVGRTETVAKFQKCTLYTYRLCPFVRIGVPQ